MYAKRTLVIEAFKEVTSESVRFTWHVRFEVEMLRGRLVKY